jgi:hypothetical protein
MRNKARMKAIMMGILATSMKEAVMKRTARPTCDDSLFLLLFLSACYYGRGNLS